MLHDDHTRLEDMEAIEIRSIEQDFEQAQQYVLTLLKKQQSADSVVSETMLVFEALCHDIFAQIKPENAPVTLLAQEKRGYVSIRFTFEGSMYIPGGKEVKGYSPERLILEGYSDRIDYSYHFGYNKILLTVRNSYIKSLLPWAIGALLAVIVYTLLLALTGTTARMNLLHNLVNPLEMLFSNAMLMIGAPVTFLSLMKNLTDTYIVAERHSNVRRIRKRIILSSMITILLAIAAALLAVFLLADPESSIAAYTHMKVEITLPEFIGSLVPSDIFSPFQMISPFPLIIVAGIATYALCSVGKYFDRLKEAIDTCYALFSRMLGIVISALPFFIFLAILDILLREGFGTLLNLLGLILLVAASMVFLILYYGFRLKKAGTPVLDFLKKTWPLLRENYKIASALDAAPYNIRYCSRVFHLERKNLELSIPVLAQLNLDGNCFFLTFISLILMFFSNTDVSWVNIVLIAVLVFFLSLGAPNQPGSVLIGITIILAYMNSQNLIPLAIICEAAFGGLLNLINITGDIITAIEESPAEQRTGPAPLS